MFDFSDATNRKDAGAFLHELICKCPEHEDDDEGNIVVLGDGLSFGGDNDWAEAVASLAKKVHAAAGEFEEVVLEIIKKLAQPCKERTANHVQWMHSLSLTGLLLKNAKSLRKLQGKAITPDELLQTLLLPGVKIVASLPIVFRALVNFICVLANFSIFILTRIYSCTIKYLLKTSPIYIMVKNGAKIQKNVIHSYVINILIYPVLNSY